MRNRRLLLTTLCAALLGVLILKSAPAGKGGGGTEPTPDPPPVTYQIVWIENFTVISVNHDRDLMGTFPTADGAEYGVIYDGVTYPLEFFFADLDVSLRFTHSLSDRAEDGSIYLSGTCDTADGIRGWLMCLTPIDGLLMQTDFSLAQPVVGDDMSALNSVNSSGEAVGLSRFSGGGDLTAIYHTSAGGTVSIGNGAPASGTQRITNAGDWIGVLFNADNSRSVYTWKPGGNLQHLVDATTVADINNPGHFVGRKDICEKKGTNTSCTDWSYFFDGTLSLLSEEADIRVAALNDYDDLLSVERIQGKRNDPIYYSGLLYFADLDREVPIDDMLDLNNTDADLARWFDANSKEFVDVTNSGVIVGYMPSGDFWATFILVPVQP
jgi:hypothetical protein